MLILKKKKKKKKKKTWRWEGAAWRNETRAWRNETRAWRRAMLKTPRQNTAMHISGFINYEEIDYIYFLCIHPSLITPRISNK